MAYRCLGEDDIIKFKMSYEGLCGITNFSYNKNDYCYEFYTYCENLLWDQITSSIVSIVNNRPEPMIDFQFFKVNLKTFQDTHIFFLLLALFFTIIAIIKGFK